MNQTYLARYRDQFGEEEILVQNDGRNLSMVIRGICFTSTNFFSISPSDADNACKHSSFPTFTFDGEELCSCALNCELPIFILLDNQTQQATLQVYIELGPASLKWNNKIQIQLNFGNNSICSQLIQDSFEEALLDLSSLLPENVYIKCCFYCAFSDYSPYGKDAFGDMACHRGNKEQYLSVQNKLDYFLVPVTEIVQENYLCPEFQKRISGTGYRG